ncbi:MAG: preprotein translocase subunit SecY [Candidatus Micrarchaeia archaeon]
MGIVEIFSSIAKLLPEVKVPESPVSIKEKLMWVAAATLIFFIMYNVTAYGVNASYGTADFLQIITASKMGSLLTVGIGPIVLASIFLQLFKGAGLINLDLSKPEERQKFHEVQKVLAIVLAFVEAGIFVYTRPEMLSNPTDGMLATIVVLQIAIGAIILFYLDEVISKYGIGSGISLFIAAGVSLAIIGGFSAVLFGENPDGFVKIIVDGGADAIPRALLALSPAIFTVLVFLLVVYAEGMKVEIPVAYTTARGVLPSLPLKFFYVSNIPVIFTSALLLNLQIFAVPILTNFGAENCGPGATELICYFGAVNSGSMHDGLLYLITPLYAPSGSDHWTFMLSSTYVFGIPQWVHAITYVLFLVLCSIPFGMFWSEIGGMDAKSVADQLNRAGLQIPGYRRDPRLLEKVLEKYISPLIIISSASVGFLAGMADLTGALGTGTGILLTVSIFYKLYEDFERLNVFEIYPQFTRMLS